MCHGQHLVLPGEGRACTYMAGWFSSRLGRGELLRLGMGPDRLGSGLPPFLVCRISLLVGYGARPLHHRQSSLCGSGAASGWYALLAAVLVGMLPASYDRQHAIQGPDLNWFCNALMLNVCFASLLQVHSSSLVSRHIVVCELRTLHRQPLGHSSRYDRLCLTRFAAVSHSSAR